MKVKYELKDIGPVCKAIKEWGELHDKDVSRIDSRIDELFRLTNKLITRYGQLSVITAILAFGLFLLAVKSFI